MLGLIVWFFINIFFISYLIYADWAKGLDITTKDILIWLTLVIFFPFGTIIFFYAILANTQDNIITKGKKNG